MQTDTTDICPVCNELTRDASSKVPVVKTNCGHTFHLACLSRWAQYTSCDSSTRSVNGGFGADVHPPPRQVFSTHDESPANGKLAYMARMNKTGGYSDSQYAASCPLCRTWFDVSPLFDSKQSRIRKNLLAAFDDAQ